MIDTTHPVIAKAIRVAAEKSSADLERSINSLKAECVIHNFFYNLKSEGALKIENEQISDGTGNSMPTGRKRIIIELR